MTDDLEIRHLALHRKVLAVLVMDHTLREIRAYYVPVEGRSHALERGGWRTDGEKMSERDATHFFPAAFSNTAYRYAH